MSRSKGFEHSVETRQKMSQVRLGKKRSPFSEEWREHMSQAHMGNKNNLGRKFSAEHRRNLAEAGRDRRQSVEICQKISKAKKKLWQDPDFVARQMRLRRVIPNRVELKLGALPRSAISW